MLKSVSNKSSSLVHLANHSSVKMLVSAAACHRNHLPHHKHVELSVAGIIFLGTPHQGTSSADLMMAVLGIMSLAMPSRTQVVEDVRPLAESLLVLQQQYRPLQDQYKTYYGYETREQRLPGGTTALIVSRESAVLPTAFKYQQIAMPADHVGIAKFEAETDPAFQLLVDALKVLMDGASKRIRNRWGSFNRWCSFAQGCICC